MRVWVDADACPVKQEIYRVAARLKVPVTLVAARWMRTPEGELFRLEVVGDGFDRADDHIVEGVGPRDLVVTDDVPLATILALIGIYGVLSFSAEQRTKEIGIRIALGSSSWAAARLVLREAALLAGLGVTLAVPVIALGAGAVESQLYGVPALDPRTLVGATLVLLAVGLLASAVPARRVSGTDPLQALRTE